MNFNEIIKKRNELIAFIESMQLAKNECDSVLLLDFMESIKSSNMPELNVLLSLDNIRYVSCCYDYELDATPILEKTANRRLIATEIALVCGVDLYGIHNCTNLDYYTKEELEETKKHFEETGVKTKDIISLQDAINIKTFFLNNIDIIMEHKQSTSNYDMYYVVDETKNEIICFENHINEPNNFVPPIGYRNDIYKLLRNKDVDKLIFKGTYNGKLPKNVFILETISTIDFLAMALEDGVLIVDSGDIYVKGYNFYKFPCVESKAKHIYDLLINDTKETESLAHILDNAARFYPKYNCVELHGYTNDIYNKYADKWWEQD